jgi:hypothetical protein
VSDMPPTGLVQFLMGRIAVPLPMWNMAYLCGPAGSVITYGLVVVTSNAIS